LSYCIQSETDNGELTNSVISPSPAMQRPGAGVKKLPRHLSKQEKTPRPSLALHRVHFDQEQIEALKVCHGFYHVKPIMPIGKTLKNVSETTFEKEHSGK